MGPGFNQLEYEAAVLRLQEIASEYHRVQPRVALRNGTFAKSLRRIVNSIASVF